ncbi:MAG: radical SAM protein [Candidatus Altiarchaeota archaeon]
MRRLKRTPYYSTVLGSMPKGCRLCVKGAKMVLFVTGVCSRRCWYCPVSERKRNKDVVIANEWWVKRDRDILEEARLCNSLGAGITGGDPTCRMEKTVKYIRLLKRTFGRRFHIHMYTSGARTSNRNLKKLYDAGLDEIRFHPLKKDWSRMKDALKFDWSVGCEIPVIPRQGEKARRFIDYIDGIGIDFLNLNELEFSETNASQMAEHGMRTVGDVSYAIKGSNELALKLLDYCRKNTSLNVHYCTLRLKDKVQLGNRLKRRARNAAREYDVVTREGLLIRGAVYLPDFYPSFSYQKRLWEMGEEQRKGYLARLRRIAHALVGYGIPERLVSIDAQRLRVLTGAWILEDIAGQLKKQGLKPALIEEYPTWDALCVDLKFL